MSMDSEQLRIMADAKADMEFSFELSELRDQFAHIQRAFTGLTNNVGLQQPTQGINQNAETQQMQHLVGQMTQFNNYSQQQMKQSSHQIQHSIDEAMQALHQAMQCLHQVNQYFQASQMLFQMNSYIDQAQQQLQSKNSGQQDLSFSHIN